jgi:hypothetical protein
MTKTILKYFWKFIGITFLIEILWYVVCFSIGYFYFPALLRNIAMVGFLILPFLTAYHTMWKQIDELETFVEAEFNKNLNPTKTNMKRYEKKKIIVKDKEVKPKTEKLVKKLENNLKNINSGYQAENIKKDKVEDINNEEEF